MSNNLEMHKTIFHAETVIVSIKNMTARKTNSLKKLKRIWKQIMADQHLVIYYNNNNNKVL